MRRVGLMPWLVVTLVLSGLQAGAFAAALPGVMGPQGAISPLLAIFAVLVLQGLKWPITLGRLADLGRPSEDAVMLLVPILSFGLFVSLVRSTPSDKKRRKALKAWEGRTLAGGAFVRGLRAMLGAPALTIPALLAAGGYAAFVELVAMPWFRELTNRPPERPNQIVGPPGDTQLLIYQVALGVLAAAALWLLVQFFNRKKASRASWLPTLILPPGLLLVVAVAPWFAEMFGPDPAPPGFFGAGLGLLWWILGGGLLATLFIAMGHDLREHGSVQTGRVLTLWRERVFGALAVHGGTVAVVFVGLQVLWVPGFVYAVIMGFAVHIAMLDPDKKAFGESQRLTRRWWRPVFAMLVLGVVPGIGLQVLSLLAVDFVQVQLGYTSPFIDEAGQYSASRMLAGWATAQAMPSTIAFPPIGLALGAALSAATMGAAQAGLVWTFHERVAQKAKKKLKKTKKPSDGGTLAEAVDQPFAPPAADV